MFCHFNNIPHIFHIRIKINNAFAYLIVQSNNYSFFICLLNYSHTLNIFP